MKLFFETALFLGPLFGGVVSMWWFNKYDLPRFWGNSEAFKTLILPASLGFIFLFIDGFFLYILGSQEDVTSLGAPAMWGGIVSAIGIFFPYAFSKKNKREWNSIPRWVKWYSRTLYFGGLIPFVVVGLIVAYEQNHWLGLAVLALFVVLGLFSVFKKKSSSPRIDPGIIKAIQVHSSIRIWLIGILLVAAVGILILHRLGLF